MGMSWKQYIAGIREFDGSVTLVGDPADIVQGSVRTAILNGSAPFVFNYYAGTNFYSGSCLVKKFSPKLSYDGALEISADTQGSGPLSYTGG